MRGIRELQRVMVAATCAAFAVLAFIGGCERSLHAVIVSAPTQVAAGDTAVIEVTTDWHYSAPESPSIQYIIDWGEDSAETSSRYPARETVALRHFWRRAGVYHLSVEPDRYSGQDENGQSVPINWTGPDETDITVIGGNEPLIDSFFGPAYAAVGESAQFSVIAHDPNGDSLKMTVQWGDSTETTTDLTPSPCTVSITHAYQAVDTVWVKVWATDAKGVESAIDSAYLRVGSAGAVIAYWRSAAGEGWSLSTSPVIVSDGASDCMWAGCNGNYTFYGISLTGMGTQYHRTTLYPEYAFNSHPAYCAATDHIIVGSEEGFLYALNVPDLSMAWTYPETSSVETLPWTDWGAAAINGNKLYVGHERDSLFYFTDQGATVTRVAAYAMTGHVVDAPAVDAAGNVHIGTDSGYLYKFDGNLNLIWRVQLLANGPVHGPVIDADGTIYCATGWNELRALNPADGSVKWTAGMNGDIPRPAVGTDGIYVGTSFQRFCKLDKATGTELWEKQSQGAEFPTTPIVAANGCVYVQDDLDLLYCFKQSNGDTLWVCNCPSYLPGGGRTRATQLTDYAPSPTITRDGNIVVVGADAVYLVKGHAEGPLDPSAPWPKWQHDLYNTGYVNGGR